MGFSTIPNSGGPGSSSQLSAVTIAVRDKVIEKFADQPLDEMNESVKQLLHKEEDEQKRLGILAARVYILRLRIAEIADADRERVISAKSPKPSDVEPIANEAEINTETSSGEWIRLQILEDCEVNGVRFPKTVVIDVRAEDAHRLVENGKAKLLVKDFPTQEDTDIASAEADTAPLAEEVGVADTTVTSEDDRTALAEPEASNIEAKNEIGEELGVSAEELSALSSVLETAKKDEEDTNAQEVKPKGSEKTESVVETPSAADITAALEALGQDSEETDVSVNSPKEDAATQSVTEMQQESDVAAELEALSDVFSTKENGDPSENNWPDDGIIATDHDSTEAEPVIDTSEIEQSSSAQTAEDVGMEMKNQMPTDSARSGEGDKPSGWFEAQQNAEQNAEDQNGEESDGSKN